MLVSSGVTILVADSQPEGDIAAPKGTLLANVQQNNVDVLYLKMSGDGKTGWVRIASVPATPPTPTGAPAALTTTLTGLLDSVLAVNTINNLNLRLTALEGALKARAVIT